jgi:Protein of unknown function (DUF3349)
MERPAFLQAIVGWLRVGYPDGVPEHDYLPLFALLRRQLCEDEVADVVRQLRSGEGEASPAAIEAAIRSVTSVLPAEADIARVRAHLAAGGWPLEEHHG